MFSKKSKRKNVGRWTSTRWKFTYQIFNTYADFSHANEQKKKVADVRNDNDRALIFGRKENEIFCVLEAPEERIIEVSWVLEMRMSM